MATVRVNARGLRYWRERRVLTTKEAADRAGVGVSTYRDLQSGYRRKARVDTIRKIANALGVEPHKLVAPEKPSVPLIGLSVDDSLKAEVQRELGVL